MTGSPSPWPKWLRRTLEAAPVGVFMATFGVFFVDKNREARTVLSSGRGLLTIGAIVAGYVTIAFVVRRWSRWAWAAPLVLTVVVSVLAAWIVRPYYFDETANRELVAGPVEEPRPEPVAGGGETMVLPASVAVPVRISSGSLRGIGHDARGTVSIIRDADGSQVVRFEDFDIEGTPDPRLYLVRGDDVRSPGGVELGRLKGNRGRILDYEVTDTDVGPGWTILVWCRAFSVPIASAPQVAT